MPILEPPATPEQAGWEEIYGPDYPYSWQTPGQPMDTPVLQNQLCRVLYDTTSINGFRIDAWDAATGAWIQQGKMMIGRSGDAGFVYPVLVSSAVMEWTPERAVISAVMRASADPHSRERVLITLQRGWTAPRFEIYSPPLAAGGAPVLALRYFPAAGDASDLLYKLDTGGAILSSSDSGGLFGSSALLLGAGGFTGENHVSVLRAGAARQAHLAVVQAAAVAFAQSSTDAYGAGHEANFLEIIVAAQYLSGQLGFCAQATDQVLEAETFRNTSSGTTTQGTDASASNGLCVSDTQTSAAAPTLTKATNLPAGKYRLLARVKIDGAAGSFQAALNGTPGPAVSVFSPAWVWCDLGDIATAASPTLTVTGWRGGGLTTSVSIDRVEAVLLEDRTASTPTYAGARDLGQSVLYDSRVEVTRVQRT